jgi:8-oxo-dGTP pyrophosphatase MutT (NUDIX family)
LEFGAAIELLLIKRAEYASDPWSGHVALPGGRLEENDASLEATAIRETWEETAIDLETNGLLIGALDELQPRSAALPPIIIAPFVFAAESDAPMELSHEVAEAFWVPVSVFQDPTALREIDLELSGGRRRVRSFGYRSHEIWGITERILSQLLGLMGVNGLWLRLCEKSPLGMDGVMRRVYNVGVSLLSLSRG